jgi:hypothetical protein
MSGISDFFRNEEKYQALDALLTIEKEGWACCINGAGLSLNGDILSPPECQRYLTFVTTFR